MSRIPVPAHHPRAPSPSSPSSEHPNLTSSNSSAVHFGTNMSSLSGFQSAASLSETRKKQSKRDEVSSLLN